MSARSGGLFVGRLDTELGIATLAEALDLFPGARVDVVGTGPDKGIIAGHAPRRRAAARDSSRVERPRHRAGADARGGRRGDLPPHRERIDLHPARHAPPARESLPLEIIEVQSGTYLGEDDIVRFDDAYGRA
jgi:glycosyltransferase involved in cell wall biosynthesis